MGNSNPNGVLFVLIYQQIMLRGFQSIIQNSQELVLTIKTLDFAQSKKEFLLVNQSALENVSR